MKHLVALSHTSLTSGAEKVLERVLVAAVGAGWSVECCVPDGPLAEQLGRAGVTTYDIPPLSLSARPLAPAAAGLSVRSVRAARVLRRVASEADVVLVNGLLGLPALRAARVRAPVVWVVHDVVRRPLWRRVVRAAAPAVRVALCVSQAAAAPVRDLGLRTVVVPQGTAWPVEPARAVAGRRPVIGCVALLTPWKGVHVLLEAFAGLADHDARLELIGDTFPKDVEYARMLRARALHPDLQGRVRFLGPTDDVLDRMRDWTLLVSPSIEPEAGPLVLFEAMSLGVPVVATAHGGPLEFLDEAGALVPPGDTHALRLRLAALLEDEGERRRMAAAGRRQVARDLVLADRLAEVLEVLERMARPSTG